MPQSLANVLLHIVFSTKERRPFLHTPDLRNTMTGYLFGILRNLNCPSLIVGVVQDHVHILCHLSRTITIADLIAEIKGSSSERIKQEGASVAGFYWQNGYGAFSVSESMVPTVQRYIENQEEHHKRVSFQDEFRKSSSQGGASLALGYRVSVLRTHSLIPDQCLLNGRNNFRARQDCFVPRLRG